MKILNIELANVEQTDLGFEHWVDVTYNVPILKNEYTVRLLLLFDFEIEDDKVIEYLVNAWKYRELVLHSVRMYEMERNDHTSPQTRPKSFLKLSFFILR